LAAPLPIAELGGGFYIALKWEDFSLTSDNTHWSYYNFSIAPVEVVSKAMNFIA
jgi:hypothetical protein